jgi:hypothetical protein
VLLTLIQVSSPSWCSDTAATRKELSEEGIQRKYLTSTYAQGFAIAWVLEQRILGFCASSETARFSGLKKFSQVFKHMYV